VAIEVEQRDMRSAPPFSNKVIEQASTAVSSKEIWIVA